MRKSRGSDVMKFRRVAIGTLLLLLSAAQQAPYYGPNGNGTLDHQDDRHWLLFHGAKIVADYAKGEYRATFGAELSRMDGRTLRITGYMLPIEPSTHSGHFILTRRSTGCPFCPPNEPTEAMEIFTTQAADYTQAPVTIEGRLKLVARSEAGLFYRIDQAKLR